MSDKTFETIKSFCKNNNYSKIQERILLHKYYEDLYILIDDYKSKEGSNPSVEIIKGFNSTLLNDMTLKTNIKLADDEIKNYTEKEIRKFERKQTFKDFSYSTLASIIGSIIFSILLIILFTIAHSQVKSWLNDLNSSNPKIESNNEIKKE